MRLASTSSSIAASTGCASARGAAANAAKTRKPAISRAIKPIMCPPVDEFLSNPMLADALLLGTGQETRRFPERGPHQCVLPAEPRSLVKEDHHAEVSVDRLGACRNCGSTD